MASYAGKNAESGTPGGPFKQGTGGHTSRGVYEPPMGKGTKSGKARSKTTNRVGQLGTRTHGAGGKAMGL